MSGLGGLVGGALDFVGLGGPEQPDAPDYTGAAEQTAAGNLEMAKYTTDANRPDMYNPFGSSTWSQGPDTIDQAGYDKALADYNAPFQATGGSVFSNALGMAEKNNAGAPDIADFTTKSNDWSNTVTLSPEQQALLDQQQQTDLYKGDLAYQGLQNTGGMFSDPYKTGLDPLQSYDDQRTGIIEQLTSRVNTDVSQDRDNKTSQLVAAGIPIGSEAYNREMETFDRRLTDANQQAELGATDIISKMLADQRANRNQTMSEDLTERQTPLNELNALTSGTQVSNPAFQDFSQQQQILGPDYLGATTATGNWDLAGWNADTAQNNAIMSGLFGVGAAYAGKPPGA